MKLKDFRKKMRKSLFTTVEARIVCFTTQPAILNLQLHQWHKSGDLTRLKRGLFMFSDASVTSAEIARSLYYPCYFSLEYALSVYGIIPEAVFIHTLVTPKGTRRFETPAGTFEYHKIPRKAFTGFDIKSLMPEKEKALVDYFYLRSSRLESNPIFWEASRLEAGATEVNFQKVFRYAKLFNSKKLYRLLTSFQSYAKSHQIYQ